MRGRSPNRALGKAAEFRMSDGSAGLSISRGKAAIRVAAAINGTATAMCQENAPFVEVESTNCLQTMAPTPQQRFKTLRAEAPRLVHLKTSMFIEGSVRPCPNREKKARETSLE